MTIEPNATETRHLPAFRDGPDEIERQRGLLAGAAGLGLVFNLPQIMLLVNGNRQIVWLNRAAGDLIGSMRVAGMRPGEALRCEHASEMAGGCGTTAFCAFCGNAAALVKAMAGGDDAEECVIRRDASAGYETLNLMVWTSPVEFGGERFAFYSARDVSIEKRNEVLERLFYHDIGNTVAGIRAMLELMEPSGGAGGSDYLDLLRSATDQLVEEIDSQRSLKAAEAGTLSVERDSVDLVSLIEKTAALFRYPLFSRDLVLELLPGTASIVLTTDAALLRRVVVNMLKNAMEASSRGETIRMGLGDQGERAAIWVWNAAVLSDEAKLRMFQRSYSTKGKGRGLGSYSMKVLAERYLGASVSFVSEMASGTTFEVSLPKRASGSKP